LLNDGQQQQRRLLGYGDFDVAESNRLRYFSVDVDKNVARTREEWDTGESSLKSIA